MNDITANAFFEELKKIAAAKPSSGIGELVFPKEESLINPASPVLQKTQQQAVGTSPALGETASPDPKNPAPDEQFQ